jgi:hypothetical protein
MTWIKTIPTAEATGALRTAIEEQRASYPQEYAKSAFPDLAPGGSIVESHTLIPEALKRHIFERSNRHNSA